MKRIGPETSLLLSLLDYASVHNWLRAHFRPARTAHGWRTPVQGDGKGFPDLVLIRPPRLVIAELKDDDEQPSPEQERWLAAWRGVPEAEVYLWRPRDWAQIEEVLR